MFQINECRKVEIIQTFSHSNIRTLFKRLFAGDHRGVVTPVPIPNTEVKGPIAEGSAGLARARVGRRRQFFFIAWSAFEGTKETKGTKATARESFSPVPLPEPITGIFRIFQGFSGPVPRFSLLRFQFAKGT